MRNKMKTYVRLSVLTAIIAVAIPGWADDEPVNPFAPRSVTREDAIKGYTEMSDGEIHPGLVYLTRDIRLKIYDAKLGRQREVPLSAVQRIDCNILKEWQEKEWRFKENANDEKVYTGRNYPVREYNHTLTLQDGRKIEGALSGIVYVQSENGGTPARFLLHKRQKGEINAELPSVIYVRSIRLGEKSYEEGLRRAEELRERQGTP